MRHVVKINNFFTLVLLIAISSCYEYNNDKSKKVIVSINNDPLIFDVTFKTFGEIQLGYDIKERTIDTTLWQNHQQDTVVFFTITLNNIGKESFVIKTSLVATKIPFLIQYKKTKKYSLFSSEKYESYNLNIIQQFNTIHYDSIIIINKSNLEYVYAKQAFFISQNKDGTESICQLPIHQINDTIDISNQKKEHTCCIDKF